MLSLVSQVAQTYFQLLELDAELEIAQRSTKTFGETLELFQRQFEGGIGTKLAVARGEAALAQAAAGIPDTERQIVSTENAISILLGWPPTPIPRGSALTSQELPPQPPAGLPADLLERRPDVLQAEQALRSANAQIGVSIADFFPRIGLTALYGGTSSELESVVKGAGNVWSIAASVTGPIFQAGKLYGGYKSAVANWEATKWQYEGVVLTALRDVSNALVDAQKLKDVRDAARQGGDGAAGSVGARHHPLHRRPGDVLRGAGGAAAALPGRGPAGADRAATSCWRWCSCTPRSAAAGATASSRCRSTRSRTGPNRPDCVWVEPG